MLSIESLFTNTHRILIAVSYAVIFMIGLYLGQGSSYVHIFRSHDETYLTFQVQINNNSSKVPIQRSMIKIGERYQTDKFSLHHYETLYEKYLPKYMGTNFILLEIGLGCGISYGPGASAYLWREYFGPEADIHFIEFDQSCGTEWYRKHGEKVKTIIKITQS